jgi:tRNA(Ile)-lysidine synthase
MIQNKFNNYIDNLLYRAASNEVALAVSGGIDSMALMHLTSSWAKHKQVKLTILSVNHNLRVEAKEEINFVQKEAKSLGHDFYGLVWTGQENKTGLQAKAREARYQLLTEKCHALNINTLLTAHHKDDIVETYIMRSRKKSGILGLSYSPVFFNNNIHILRPLTEFTKDDIVNYISLNNINWVEDKSNLIDLYERNRVRKEVAKFSNEKKEQLVAKIQEINIQARKLNELLLEAMSRAVQINNYGFALIKLKKMIDYPEDIRIYLLNYVLTIISGKDRLPRFRSIEKILLLLKENKEIKHSLHGCMLRRDNCDLIIIREKSAIQPYYINIGRGLFWDNRFVLETDFLDIKYSVTTLDDYNYGKLKQNIDLTKLVHLAGNNYKSVLFTLPVIKNLEKVVAIPHIFYYDKTEFSEALKVTFRPGFVSRFTHFL